MSRDNEFECLKYVINTYYVNNNATIVFCNVKNRDELFKQLTEVKPNSHSSEFPDFISNSMVVEHFSITSSKENRKGSSFKKEQSANVKKTQAQIVECRNSYSNMPFERNKIVSNTIKNTYDDLSYNNFINSLKKKLQHHIDSLREYDIQDKKTIFMIELQDALMGIYRHNAFYKFYELHNDKNAIEVLKPYLDSLDVIIFRAHDRIEIIDMKKINDMYKYSCHENDIKGGRLKEIDLFNIIDL